MTEASPQPPGDPPANEEWEVTPRQVHASLRGDGPRIFLLDCRTNEEMEISRIDGAVHIPMDQIPARLDELADLVDEAGESADAPPRVVVSCRSGRRSLTVAAVLRESGFPGAVSMAGGINWWARQIDPSLPVY